MSAFTNMDTITPLTFDDFDWLLNTSSENLEMNAEESMYPAERPSAFPSSSGKEMQNLSVDTTSETDDHNYGWSLNHQPVSHWKDLDISNMDMDTNRDREMEKPVTTTTFYQINQHGASYWKNIVLRGEDSDETSSGSSSRSETPYVPRPFTHIQKHQVQFCNYCKNISNVPHSLYTEDGRINCPELRKVICPNCGATGDRAHIGKRCPVPVMRIFKGDPTVHPVPAGHMQMKRNVRILAKDQDNVTIRTQIFKNKSMYHMTDCFKMATKSAVTFQDYNHRKY